MPCRMLNNKQKRPKGELLCGSPKARFMEEEKKYVFYYWLLRKTYGYVRISDSIFKDNFTRP